MIFKDLKLTDTNHFVAMEYYWLMLNRTFLIVIQDDFLFGIKVNGLVSIDAGANPLARQLIQPMVVRGDLENPYSYIKPRFITKMEDIDLVGSDFLEVDNANFRIKTSDIDKVTFNPTKKWGMGYYPHDGKVYVTTKNKEKREFIILGQQSGNLICNLIRQKAASLHDISLLQ